MSAFAVSCMDYVIYMFNLLLDLSVWPEVIKKKSCST